MTILEWHNGGCIGRDKSGQILCILHVKVTDSEKFKIQQRAGEILIQEKREKFIENSRINNPVKSKPLFPKPNTLEGLHFKLTTLVQRLNGADSEERNSILRSMDETNQRINQLKEQQA